MAGEIVKKFGAWLTATLTSSTTSQEVNLGYPFQKLLVLIPTLGASGTSTVHVSNASGGTFFPLYALDDDATGDFVNATTAATTTKAVIFDIGGAQFVKVVSGASQTSEIYNIRGFNP